ncbi:hypothetical protein MGYG_04541 [Nannizzia gypsea CBS 118893]|uniref:HNH nuclease domain-containing protein n=1 Tax=Arthroderma gypseum (strain ATCC MYA-4604 / CBS 118893) TaxID=535722 RepID=E4UTJ3_ARTGP|nr:hypothetical protein MGYG_04541 [Nannizzia gypsea CBS 118893]EFR01538.1 hypothetical protein MGYG_04541 [Nannizzia gypsea CBS 118893]
MRYHLSGWEYADEIVTAHLIPKTLKEDGPKHLFGENEVVLEDSKNGLTLHRRLEQTLNNRTIAIVPGPPVECEITKWKCILVHGDLREQTGIHSRGVFRKWKGCLTLNLTEKPPFRM